jgi:hypothetical protein
MRGFSPATVTVDAGSDLGVLNNPAWYLNQSDPIPAGSPHELSRVAELKPRVVRVWLKPNRYWDEIDKRYQFDYDWGGDGSLYQYLDQASGMSSELMVNIDQCAPTQMDWRDPQQCREILKAGLLHYKIRYPKIRYVEVFNEPDKTWEPQAHERPAIAVGDYYEWYRVAYQVVAEVNAAVLSGPPLAIGGPAAYTFNPAYLKAFLDRYAADSDPLKRLDFLSYHQYRARENPASVRDEKTRIQEWLKERAQPASVPIYVTEYGVFPGNNGTDDMAADELTQAAAMAALGMSYASSNVDMPMHWVVQHTTNQRKSMVVVGGGGAVYPYYNLVLMQSMMKSIRLDTRSDRMTGAGLGVNALASGDASGLSILVTNYQWTTGRQDYDVTIELDNLPAELRGVPLRFSTYLIDSRAGNHASDGRGDLRHFDEVRSDQTPTVTVSLEHNAIALMTVSVA